MAIKAIAMDIDGTLTNDQKVISRNIVFSTALEKNL